MGHGIGEGDIERSEWAQRSRKVDRAVGLMSGRALGGKSNKSRDNRRSGQVSRALECSRTKSLRAKSSFAQCSGAHLLLPRVTLPSEELRAPTKTRSLRH
eukprot:1799810-Pleurochrysis_carterae.AAC.1